MSQRPIVIAPDPKLKQRADAVPCVDGSVRELMDEMLSAMYTANGVGLAAPQLGVAQRVIVVDVSPEHERGKALVMANPVIEWHSEDRVSAEEGCLSLPDHYADVARPSQIRVTFLDQDNNEKTLEADGLLARCIQHECDHLEGVLFVDHISSIKRNIILRKLTKAKRHGELAPAS
jgi:peptide deformylase